jgi:hypothetical protein
MIMRRDLCLKLGEFGAQLCMIYPHLQFSLHTSVSLVFNSNLNWKWTICTSNFAYDFTCVQLLVWLQYQVHMKHTISAHPFLVPIVKMTCLTSMVAIKYNNNVTLNKWHLHYPMLVALILGLFWAHMHLAIIS